MKVSEVPKRAAVYARISETDDDFDKVAEQERRCRKLAADSGYVVADVYRDDGISAFSGIHRPQWIRLLSDIELGKFDVVVAVAQDRFSRNTAETNVFLVMCARTNTLIHTQLNGQIDPEQPMVKAMATMIGVMAELESEIKRFRIRLRFNKETEDGNTLWGQRSFGYNLRTKENPLITVRENEAELLRAAYKRLDEDEAATVYAIVKEWNNMGVPTASAGTVHKKLKKDTPASKWAEPKQWSYQTMTSLLKNPRNAGKLVRHGKVVGDGAWEPIVNEDLWERVVTLLSNPDRNTTDTREPRHLSAGIARCGVCGGPLRSSSSHPKGGSKIAYYRCAAGRTPAQRSVRHTAVRGDELDPLVRQAVIRSVFHGHGEGSMAAGGSAELSALDLALSRVRARRTELQELSADSSVKVGDLAKGFRAVDTEERTLTERRALLTSENAHAAMVSDLQQTLWDGPRVSIVDAAALMAGLGRNFDALSLAKRRTLVRDHLAVTVYPGRKPGRVDIQFLRTPSLNDDADEREPTDEEMESANARAAERENTAPQPPQPAPAG